MEDVLADRKHLDLTPHLPLLHADATLWVLQQLLAYHLRVRPQYLVKEENGFWLVLLLLIFLVSA